MSLSSNKVRGKMVMIIIILIILTMHTWSDFGEFVLTAKPFYFIGSTLQQELKTKGNKTKMEESCFTDQKEFLSVLQSSL